MKAKLMIARFPYGGGERTETVDYLMQVHHRAMTDPRVAEVVHWKLNDTPITMGRNRCLAVARQQGCDLVLMVDSDMAPDLYAGRDPLARPFYDVAMDFVFGHAGPCVVAAPYCGPPPHENVYVFRWRNWQSDTPDPNASLEQYTREEAAGLSGVTEVAALPTGLMLLDMRFYDRVAAAKRRACEEAFKRGREIKPTPFFYYEWTDDAALDKASTEDVTFSRDLSLAGVPQYCAWDSWAGHVKAKVVGKPMPLRPDCVAEQMHAAILSRAPRQGERLIYVGGRDSSRPPSALAQLRPEVTRG